MFRACGVALRDDFVVRDKLPPTPVPENKSTPKSRVTPHLAGKSPLQSQGIGKSSPAPYLSPQMLRRTNILIQTNCLQPKNLHVSRIELMTRCARQRRHADSPILSLSRHVRAGEGRRGARRRRAQSCQENPGPNLVRIRCVSASEE